MIRPMSTTSAIKIQNVVIMSIFTFRLTEKAAFTAVLGTSIIRKDY
jgi:hypothetical protein